MKRALTLIVLAALSFAVRAGDLSSISSLQSSVINHQQVQADAEVRNQALAEQIPLISRQIMLTFFQQASNAGVKFDPVDLPERESSAGVTTTYTVRESLYGGRFVYVMRCVITCDNEPFVRASGVMSPMSLYVTFEDSANKFATCDNTDVLKCVCDFGVADYRVPCADLFNKAKRAQVTNAVVKGLNEELKSDLQAASRN